jgi:hypothetical protein
MKREKKTPGLDFRGPSSDETRTTSPRFQGLPKMSDKGGLSDMIAPRQERRLTA